MRAAAVSTLPLADLALCVLALFAAGTVKGVTGLGIPLVSVPVMSLVVEPVSAAAVIVIPSVLANIVQLRDGGPALAHLRRHRMLVLGLLLGVPVGSWWLATGSTSIVQALLAVLVLGFVALRVAQPQLTLPARHEARVGMVAGLAGGVVGGMTVLFGPVVITYLAALRLGRDEFIGAISNVYLICTVGLMLAYLAVGVLDGERLLASAAAVAPVLAGVGIGRRLRQHIEQGLFERGLLAMLGVIGVSLLYRALA